MRRVALACAPSRLAALVAVGLAHDAHSWQSAIARGDARYARTATDARWSPVTWLPGDPAARLLPVEREVALRRAVQAFRRRRADRERLRQRRDACTRSLGGDGRAVERRGDRHGGAGLAGERPAGRPRLLGRRDRRTSRRSPPSRPPSAPNPSNARRQVQPRARATPRAPDRCPPRTGERERLRRERTPRRRLRHARTGLLMVPLACAPLPDAARRARRAGRPRSARAAPRSSARRGRRAVHVLGLRTAGLRRAAVRPGSPPSSACCSGSRRPSRCSSPRTDAAGPDALAGAVRRRRLPFDAGVGGPRTPTRLERARNVVARLRADVADVPAGLAGLTDRVLPYVFPTAAPSDVRATCSSTRCSSRRRRRRTSELSRRASTRSRPFARDGFFARCRHRDGPASSSPTARARPSPPPASRALSAVTGARSSSSGWEAPASASSRPTATPRRRTGRTRRPPGRCGGSPTRSAARPTGNARSAGRATRCAGSPSGARPRARAPRRASSGSPRPGRRRAPARPRARGLAESAAPRRSPIEWRRLKT